jgi:hypothetical protein
MVGGRLAQWNPEQPDLRDWSDSELLGGLHALGIRCPDRTDFLGQAASVPMQSALEDQWLDDMVPPAGGDLSALQAFVFLTVQELWERWQSPSWPPDRLARMWLYLVDADFSVQWADSFHAPTADQVLDAVQALVTEHPAPAQAFAPIVTLAELSEHGWPTKLLDAMAEWCEIGNLRLAERAGGLLATILGHGHALAYVAAALVSARMTDKAQEVALQVPLDAKLDPRFGELVGYLCLCGGGAMQAATWLHRSDKASHLRASEMTYAAEAVREWLQQQAAATSVQDNAEAVPAPVRAAARQGAAQACYFAMMGFAGHQPGQMPTN